MAGLEAALGLIAARLASPPGTPARARCARGGEQGEAARALFTTVPAARSVSVTAVQVAPGIDPEQLRSVARERFQVAIAGGLGPLSGRVFRIGHLGDMNEAMILGCLAGVQAALRAEGIPCGSDGVDAAVSALLAQDA
jgi:alanine-glyoxylate transaminase/serine-glyoxylate transaminase/serine-pyruvate transaminase